MDAIPAKALPYLPRVAIEARRLRSPVPPAVLAAVVDHETGCPGMRSCWSPDAKFKTYKADGTWNEEGRGFGMITRVSGRFDAMAELRAKHRAELAGWSWETVSDAQKQIVALVLKFRDNWATVAGLFRDPLPAVITAYNRGTGGVLASRRLCAARGDCDPTRWDGHVAKVCTSGNRIIPGTRFTACQISGKYAPDVLRRAPKYGMYYLRKK